jgi:hypothetical protein
MLERVRTIMVNELAVTGILIRELRKSGIEVTAYLIDEVDRELTRVGKVLLTAWSEKRLGMEYYIDFHYSEAKRLYESIGLTDIQCLQLDLRELQYAAMYLAISARLTELMMDLSTMK